MKINNINELIVLFNKEVVGKLKLSNTNTVYFQYHKNWLNKGFSISPLKLPLVNKIFEYKPTINNPIWGVFNDCLPDGWGTLITIKKCAINNIDYHQLNILEKLSLTNDYSLGGLDFIPSNNQSLKSNINLDLITNDVIKNYHLMKSFDCLDILFKNAGSSGGARPKIHFCDEFNDWWIIKFPTSKDDLNVGLNEYLANKKAQSCEINVNEYKLFNSKVCPLGLFGAKRFDIKQNIKLHTITIAGLLDLDFRTSLIDYTTIFELIQFISANKLDDYYEMFKRMVFNYYLPNKDDH